MKRRDFLRLTALTSLSVAMGVDNRTNLAFGAARRMIWQWLPELPSKKTPLRQLTCSAA